MSTPTLPDAPPAEAELEDQPLVSDGWGPYRPWVVGGTVLALAVGVVLRFVVTSPLWLDEALSVNIARLPLGDIAEALKHDGHPPLYYYELHAWMKVFGEGDLAVRSLSALWGLLLLPLAWILGGRIGGRRVAWLALLVTALSPFAVRYATETRMYAMVMVLVVAGWLLMQDALREPKPWRLVGLGALTGALLLSHYWAMYLLVAVAAALLWHIRSAHRAGDAVARAAGVKVLLSLALGSLLFVPWLPTLLYQGQHTGTPWANPIRPAEIVSRTAVELGGQTSGESTVFGWLTIIAALLGLLGAGVGARHIDLDLRGRVRARPAAWVLGATLAVAAAAGYATRSTYAPRYFAVAFPFLVVLAALGLACFHGRTVAFFVLAAFLGFSGINSARNVIWSRSQAEDNAALITAAAEEGDYVVYCPDQLGPSTSRVLPSGRLEQVTYPEFGAPDRVDWVDYKERLAATSPEEFADELLRRADGRQIFLVWSDVYTTHTKICPELTGVLQRSREWKQLAGLSDAYEPAYLFQFTTAPVG